MYSNVVEARGRIGTVLATQFDADGKELKVRTKVVKKMVRLQTYCRI